MLELKSPYFHQGAFNAVQSQINVLLKSESNFKEQGTLITGWNLTCGHNIALFFSMHAQSYQGGWVGC